ncbi:MAG: DEAD/DEAH box helicase, partial [Thaumarchaeota archaeon]|nr:DEAD/DEAH box helicase [Nitrososphaerota archaeon]
LLVSPTASGKSLIIYILVRYLKSKTLILVPTTSLVSQMYNDFLEYGWDVANNCHTVWAGRDKGSELPVIISTWQSIYKMPQKYFEQYELVIGDEAHGFKSKSLTSIMTKCVNAKYRIGATGTLDGTLTHKLVLEGLFGSVYKVTTTKKLIDDKHLSPFTINALVLRHPDSICHTLKNINYQEELEYLISSKARNKYIVNLALGMETNTLLLFRFVEKHGRLLYNMIKEQTDVMRRKTFFVFGGTNTDTREQIRHIVESESNAIIVASYGVFGVGVNIRNLHNIIFASPTKSRIRNLQAIGRALRKAKKKEVATLYDIADDLRHGEKSNYTLGHFKERVQIYKEENFPMASYHIQLKQ